MTFASKTEFLIKFYNNKLFQKQYSLTKGKKIKFPKKIILYKG